MQRLDPFRRAPEHVPALALALLVAAAGCNGEPAFRRRAHEEELIGEIRQTLLASVEAEKSAVLATTDDESARMAREARELATRTDHLLDELRALITADGRPAELERLDALDASWQEVVAVDERLLALAVANTNLKAAQLSAREGNAALDRFVEALAGMQASSADPETIRVLGDASVAALRAQTLLLIHIPTAGEPEMVRLEQQMALLGAAVDRALATLSAAGRLPAATLDGASSAWNEYRRIAAEVVRLSRENTNLRSFDVSVHEKRRVTRECLDALDSLLSAVRSGPQPAR